MGEAQTGDDRSEAVPHLFRTEYRKIVSVLCKRFGFADIDAAEDIASETFVTAAQVWGLKGLPPNPAAWLYAVAKNKAKNHLDRLRRFKQRVEPEIVRGMEQSQSPSTPVDLGAANIFDSQLRLIFAICRPSIALESQVAMALRLLCGFGIEEIADAFLTSKETVNKRLLRAKQKLRSEAFSIELPDRHELTARVDAVLVTIYLLFNEGYHSRSNTQSVRKDLCLEAVRLCHMLTEYKASDLPKVNALLALMCFHASRLDARMGDSGEQVLYKHQDRSLWNQELIAKGVYFLGKASAGKELSRYHIEAGIAYWHTVDDAAPGRPLEKWEHILYFYNRLLQIEYSPLAALNRTYALAKVRGDRVGIEEAEKLKMTKNHLYYALLGELCKSVDPARAEDHFKTALSKAKTESDKNAIRREIDALRSIA